MPRAFDSSIDRIQDFIKWPVLARSTNAPEDGFRSWLAEGVETIKYPKGDPHSKSLESF